MGLLISTGPLRESRAFARLWGAGALTSVTTQMAQMAIAWTVYDHTRSSLAVGAIGLAIGLPTLLFGLVGGAITDTRRPKVLGLFGVSGQLAISLALLAMVLSQQFSLPLLYLLLCAQAAFAAVTSPTRRPYIRHLLAPGSIAAAMSLYMLSMNIGQILGPIAGGQLLDKSTIAVIFAIHAAALVPYLISVLSLPDLAPASKAKLGLGAIAEGLKATWQTRSIRSVILADVFATFFALPMALLPAMNEEVLGGNAKTYGWLLAALSIGGLIGTLLSGWLEHVGRPVRFVSGLAISWCVLVAILGMNSFLLAAIMLLLVMGILDVWSIVLQRTGRCHSVVATGC